MKISKGARLLMLGVLLVVVDQVIKVLVKTNMSLGEVIPVFGDWFRLCFVENEGMAFGMKFGGGCGKVHPVFLQGVPFRIPHLVDQQAQ